jgi:hypothetical protein
MGRQLVDRKSIIEWADAHQASPARVSQPGDDQSDPGLRLAFKGNGYDSDEPLTPISWDEWFKTFEDRGLAFVVEDPDGDGGARR